MSYELAGTLYEKFDEIQRTPTFKVREFVIENTRDVNGNPLTNYIKFQCTQDRTAIIDKFNKGEQVRVLFNIRGSKWQRDGKVSYFNNLDAWKVESALSASAGNIDSIASSQDDNNDLTANEDVEDDLPF